MAGMRLRLVPSITMAPTHRIPAVAAIRRRSRVSNVADMSEIERNAEEIRTNHAGVIIICISRAKLKVAPPIMALTIIKRRTKTIFRARMANTEKDTIMNKAM